MALNFPTGATLNQVYTSGDNSWIWNGYAWNAYNPNLTTSRFAMSGSNAYIGIAPTFATESSTNWTITRLTLSLSGTVTQEAIAQPQGGVNWTGYLSHTYL